VDALQRRDLTVIGRHFLFLRLRNIFVSPSPHILTASKLLGEIHQQLDSIVLGKSEVTRLAVTCLLAQGHLLIEDAPGLGK